MGWIRPGLFMGLFVFALSILPGCWDSQRLEERAIILGMGVDPGPGGQLRVSANNPVFESPDVAPERIQRITTLAPSLMAAMDNLNRVSDKRYSVGQMRVALFNSELAQAGKIGILAQDLIHNPLVSQITNLAVVEGSCQEILNLDLKDKPRVAPYINALLTDALKRRNIQSSELLFVHSQLHNPLVVTMLPYLTYGETEVKVSGEAVLKKGKLAAVISTEESGLAQAVKGDAKNFLFSAPFSADDVISPRIVTNKTRRKLSWQGGVPVFDIDVDLQVDLIGRHIKKHVNDDADLKEIQGKLEQYLGERYSRMIDFSQEKNIDIFRLGELVRQQKGGRVTPEWWDETYPRARVEINPRVEIRRIGRTM